MKWEIKKLKKKKYKNAVMIEGLPGIGNVGKIAADLLLQELKSEKIAEFFSYSMPNTVFVQEDNTVKLPSIEVHHASHNSTDFIFLVGDIQPTDEIPSYEFADSVLEYSKELGITEIVTLGGIGLHEVPKKPKVYCTGNDKGLMKEFSKQGANEKIYGKVGPIMGVSGLLLGLGERKKIKAVALLAETLAHPMYLGLKGAREILKVLKTRYRFDISMEDLEKEIKQMEQKLKQSLANVQQVQSAEGHPEMSYIG